MHLRNTQRRFALGMDKLTIKSQEALDGRFGEGGAVEIDAKGEEFVFRK